MSEYIRKHTESRSNIYHERNKQFEQEASFKYKIFRFALRYSGFKTGRGTLILVPASWEDGHRVRMVHVMEADLKKEHRMI
ncbi:hypothetical protein NPIL_520991 [Nephila pilipes]|uniref:Uncharacterized protein n=1 Tax=Nephila pilipes TaxID=299642 RepID=A0A8X6NHF4_NEPPI|nr:hypothetical protein NPIL_520991 [Nephila pilipes]